MKQISKAFTLVELIVVITILAILGTIAFISLQGYSKTARNSVRLSDISSIKTSLELYLLNTGKYPLPDNGQDAIFSGETIWTQGTVGDSVTTNLSKNLTNKPTDPLFETDYTYSVTDSKNEYQVMSVYEGEIALNNNILSTTNASNNEYFIKVDGTYNEIFVKTPNYIVPTPSIINSEINGATLILDSNNIKSQVITNGINFPNINIPNTTTQTGGLTGLNLSVYTGAVITSKSTNQDKINVINAIQNAYIGTILTNEPTYKNILNKITPDDKIILATTLILNEEVKPTNGNCGVDNGGSFSTTPTNLCNAGNATTVIDLGVGNNYSWLCDGVVGGTNASCTATHILPSTDGACGSDVNGVFITTPTNLCSIGNVSTLIDEGAGSNYTWTCDGISGGNSASCTATHNTIYPGCDTQDIIVGTYVLAACNVGTNIAGTTSASYGGYYQWGNNADQTSTPSSSTKFGDTTGYSPSTFSNATFIISGFPGDWTTTKNNNLWGDTINTNIARIGPCASGYHVPSKLEWAGIVTAGGWGTTDTTGMINILKLSHAGAYNGDYRSYILGVEFYWSSSVKNSYGSHLYIDNGNIVTDAGDYRGTAGSVRCFRN